MIQAQNKWDNIPISSTDLQNKVVRVLMSTGPHDGGGCRFGGLFTHVRGATPARRTDSRGDRDGGRTCQRRKSENFEIHVVVEDKLGMGEDEGRWGRNWKTSVRGEENPSSPNRRKIIKISSYQFTHTLTHTHSPTRLDFYFPILYTCGLLAKITPGNARATRRRLRPHTAVTSGSDGGDGVGGLDRTGGPGMMSARERADV